MYNTLWLRLLLHADVVYVRVIYDIVAEVDNAGGGHHDNKVAAISVIIL